jgi:hypothetical protein
LAAAIYAESGMSAVGAGEEVVPLPNTGVAAPSTRTATAARQEDKKTLENKVLHDALELTQSKKVFRSPSPGQDDRP